MAIPLALLVLSVFPIEAESLKIAIIAEYETTPAQRAMEIMRQYVSSQLKAADVDVVWPRSAAKPEEYARIVRVRFQGSCYPAERGMLADADRFGVKVRLAAARLIGKEVAPEADVFCDNIHQVLRNVPFRDHGAEFAKVLGRVLTHELYHILAKTADHGLDGLSKGVVGWKEIIRSDFVLTDQALRLIQGALAKGPAE